MSATPAGYAQDFLDFKIIQTTINGVEVDGHFEASFYNIKTIISKPFKNICDHCHIPYFAQGHFTYHSEHGELRAQYSLKNIYRVGEYLLRKEEILERKYQEFEQRKSEISEGRIGEDEFKLKRRVLRKRLKSGDISNRAYQRRIRSMRREVEAFEKRIWKLEDSFFEAYFPMPVFGSMRESVLDILDGKKSLV
jgi:hypothetical protein